mmetsp:Transcript_22802/g.76970  ORF Transcript_22802/g.76970 Transcript_22802/m.76970 type:complete len:200 (-) Transcript_22802:854-1453(-)
MPRHKSSGWLAPRRVTPSAVQRQSFSSASRAPGRAALAGAALRRVDRAEAPDGVRDEGERHGEGVLHLAGGSQRRVQAAEAVARVEAQRRDVRCPQPRSDRVWEVDKVLQRHAGRPARVHHPVAPPTSRAASCSLVQSRVLSTCYTPLLHAGGGGRRCGRGGCSGGRRGRRRCLATRPRVRWRRDPPPCRRRQPRLARA